VPRLRGGVKLSEYELALLARALTTEQRYSLIDAGWDDVAAMFDFAMRRLPELRELWDGRLARVPRGAEDAWLLTMAREFWDQAVPLLLANRPPRDAAAAVERAATSGGDSGNVGGANRKTHPGIALHEAAHLILHEQDMSDTKIAAAATEKAREHPKLTPDVLQTHRWADGMHRTQVPFLRQAISDRLIRVKGGATQIRANANESWRPLAADAWAAIPRAE
jgi:hypothetical protein